jgi:hypothetical protein
MERRLELITSLLLAGGVIMQAVVLAGRSPLNLLERVQFFAAAVGAAILVAQLWRWRQYFSPHADMLVLMLSLGGAGMLLSVLDDPSCHADGWAETIRINSIMVVTGLLPAVPLSRCLQQARRSGTLVRTLALDTIGMIFGMKIVTFLSLKTSARWEPIVTHGLMITGMLAGMGVAMVARDLGLKRRRHERRHDASSEHKSTVVAH